LDDLRKTIDMIIGTFALPATTPCSGGPGLPEQPLRNKVQDWRP
jgi:hypothetical protein